MLPEYCCQPLNSARFDWPPYTGFWLCVDAELAIGQCRLWVQGLAIFLLVIV